MASSATRLAADLMVLEASSMAMAAPDMEPAAELTAVAASPTPICQEKEKCFENIRGLTGSKPKALARQALLRHLQSTAWACLVQAWPSPLVLLWASPCSPRWRSRACLANA